MQRERIIEIMTVALAFVILLSNSGCKKDSPSGSDDNNPPPPTQGSGTIAFLRFSAQSLYIGTVKPDGSGDTLLPIRAWRSPVWSPDGQKIAYSRRKPNTSNQTDEELCVISPDGSGFISLTDSRTDISQLDYHLEMLCSDWQWSPDGSVLAYVHLSDTRSGPYYPWHLTRLSSIMTVNVSTRALSSIHQSTRDTIGGATLPGELYMFAHRLPNWNTANSETRLVFQMSFDSTMARYAGEWKSFSWLFPNGTVQPYSEINGRLSPDGQSIVSAAGEIYVNDHPVTSNGATNQNPSWSPDGNWIVFESNATGRYEVYIVKKDGTGYRQVTQRGGMMPSWGRL